MAKEERTQKYGFRGTVGNVDRKSRFFTKKPMPPQPTPEQLAQPGVMEQIFTGWGNLMKSHFMNLSPELKELGEMRLKLCNGCEMRNGGSCSTSKEGIHVVTGQKVRGCGCRLAAKALSPGSVCPLGKW